LWLPLRRELSAELTKNRELIRHKCRRMTATTANLSYGTLNNAGEGVQPFLEFQQVLREGAEALPYGNIKYI